MLSKKSIKIRKVVQKNELNIKISLEKVRKNKFDKLRSQSELAIRPVKQRQTKNQQQSLTRPIFLRRFNIDQYIAKLEFTIKSKQLQSSSSGSSKTKLMCLQIGETWLRTVIGIQQLMGYFMYKNRFQFVNKFAQLLMLVLREQSTTCYNQLKKVHRFPVKGTEYNITKNALFKIVFSFGFSGFQLFNFFRRFEYLKLCFYPENQLFTKIPLEAMVQHLLTCGLQLSRQALSITLYFLFHSFGIQSLHQYIKSKKVRIFRRSMTVFKSQLIKLLNSIECQDFTYRLLFQNLRFVECLLVTGSSLTDYIDQKFQSIQKFISEYRQSGSIIKKHKAIAVKQQSILLYYLLESNYYSLSCEDFGSLIAQRTSKQSFSQFVLQLVQFIKNKKFPQIYVRQLTKDVKRLLNYIYSKPNLDSSKIFQLAKQQYLKYNQISSFCGCKSLDLLCRKVITFDVKQLLHLHEGKQIGPEQFKFFRQCLDNFKEEKCYFQAITFLDKMALDCQRQ